MAQLMEALAPALRTRSALAGGWVAGRQAPSSVKTLEVHR